MVIAGRPADVDLALGHDDVRALAAQKAAERGGTSKRAALAKEGQIEEGSPAWEDMSAGDRTKRKRAAGARWLRAVGELGLSGFVCLMSLHYCDQALIVGSPLSLMPSPLSSRALPPQRRRS